LIGLASVGDYLFITDNDALTSLDGLSALASVGDDLSIEDNNALTSLAGLRAVTSIGDTLVIFSNDALPACAAEALDTRMRALGWAGTTRIATNDGSGTCD